MLLSVLIAGCGDGISWYDGPTVYRGRVLDERGAPVQGALVALRIGPAVTTDPTGAFELVAFPPADILVRIQNSLYLFSGLSRSDPKLWLIGYSSPPQPTSEVLFRGDIPLENNQTAVVILRAGSMNGWTRVVRQGNSGTYSFTVSWKSAAATERGELHLLRWTSDANGRPASFDGTSRKPVSLSPGANYELDFSTSEISDPAESVIWGYLEPPAGATFGQVNIKLQTGGPAIQLYPDASPTSNTFSYVVPRIDDYKYLVEAYYTLPSGGVVARKAGIPAGSSGVSIPLPSPPVLLEPADAQASVDTTTIFRWRNGAGGGVNWVYMQGGTGERLFIFTADSICSLPSVAHLGASLPRNTTFSWGVNRFRPVPSVDYLCSATYRSIFIDQTGDNSWGLSPFRSFTTR